jgi:hypothetical protein
MNKIFKTGLAIALIATMSVGLLTGCGGNKTPSDTETPVQNQQQSNQKVEKTINLNDYIKVSFDGRDGQGHVNWNYDGWDGEESYLCIYGEELAEKLAKYTIGLYDRSSLKSTIEGKDNHDISVFMVVSSDEAYNLSNGDAIHFTWKINERGLRLLKEQVPGVNFVWEDFDAVVEGLEGVREFDPFNCDGMEAFIDFTYGEGGRLSGQATMSNWEFLVERVGDGSYGRVDIEVDEMGHTGAWKNGDQIKVTITSSDEYILEEFGVKFTTKTGVITVDWLDEPNE